MRLALLLFSALVPLFATATFTKARTFYQSDGTPLHVRLTGDAFMHYYIADDGAVLLFNKRSGNFEYAVIKDGFLRPSGSAYNPKTRSAHKSLSKEELKKLWLQKHK